MDRITTRYNWKDLVSAGLAFSGVEITDAGADAFYLTDLHAFLEDGFSLNTQADGLGIDITNFVLSEKNDQLSRVYDKDVYEKVQILNVTYQTGTIYATGFYSGDVNFAEYFNTLQGQIDALMSGTSNVLLGSRHTFFIYEDLSAYGLLAYTHDSFSQANYQGLFNKIGHLFNEMHVAAGGADLSASGTLFYATPIPGYYERGGTKDTAVIDSTADIDDTAELITLTTADYDALHLTRGVIGTGADGVPVRLKLVSGALPTGLAIDTTYFIRFKTTPDIELYTDEASAIDTTATTNRVGLTDAVGTFQITQEGIVLEDQANSIDTLKNGSTAGASPITVPDDGSYSSFLTMSAGGSTRNFAVAKKGVETRPKTFISFGYIKAEHVTTSGEPISALRYSTGWIANSDWTNAEFTVTHNLSSNLSDLIVKFFVSTDGTEANAFEVGSQSTAVAAYGSTTRQVSTSEIIIQTGTSGIVSMNDSGVVLVIDIESYYYKVVVTKPNLVATYADTSFRKVFDIAGATDETFVLPDATTVLTEYFIKRTGAGTGVVNFTTVSGQTINGTAPAGWDLDGDSFISLMPVSGNWEVKDIKSMTVLADYPTRKYNGTITLSEALTNFEYLVVKGQFSTGDTIGFTYFPTDLISTGNQLLQLWDYATHYASWTYTDTTTLTFSAESNSWIRTVYGMNRKK